MHSTAASARNGRREGSSVKIDSEEGRAGERIARHARTHARNPAYRVGLDRSIVSGYQAERAARNQTDIDDATTLGSAAVATSIGAPSTTHGHYDWPRGTPFIRLRVHLRAKGRVPSFGANVTRLRLFLSLADG